MHTTHSNQMAQPHPTIQEHNAETKIPVKQHTITRMPEINLVSRLEEQSTCNSYQKQETGHQDSSSEVISPRTYRVKTLNGGIYIRNREFIKPRYTDSRQSLETIRRDTKPTEHAPHNYRPKTNHQKATETNRNHELYTNRTTLDHTHSLSSVYTT